MATTVPTGVSGLVSGIDTASLVTKIMSLERMPVTTLQNKMTNFQNQKTAWQDVSTKLLTLETASNALNTNDKFSSRSSSFQTNNAAGGSVLSAVAGPNVASGTYSFKVNNLAQVQKSISNQSFADSSAAMGVSGTLVASGASTWRVSISASDSLQSLQSKINSSGMPMTASIVNVGTSASPQYRLSLSGSKTGAANAVKLNTSVVSGMSFATTQAATNASLTVDGVNVVKDSNSFSDLVPGATINLQTAGSGTLSFSTDTSTITSKIQTFVNAYNDLSDYMNQQLSYDPSQQQQGGPLFGNANLLTIQNQLRNMINGSVPGLNPYNMNTLVSLSQIGLTTDDTNHLTINSNTLSSALTNRFMETRRLFTQAGSGTYTFVAASGKTAGGDYATRVQNGTLQIQSAASGWVSMAQDGNFASGPVGSSFEGLLLQTGTLVNGQTGHMNIIVGVAQRVSTITAMYTEFSTAGLIYNQNASIDTSEKDLQAQIDDMNQRLDKKQQDLQARFTNMEVLMAKLTSQQTYLTSQLGGSTTSSTTSANALKTL